MVLTLSHCVGRVLRVRVAETNPELFRSQYSRTPLLKQEVFSNLYGYCSCSECRDFYNQSMPDEVSIVPTPSSMPANKPSKLDYQLLRESGEEWVEVGISVLHSRDSYYQIEVRG